MILETIYIPNGEDKSLSYLFAKIFASALVGVANYSVIGAGYVLHTLVNF